MTPDKPELASAFAEKLAAMLANLPGDLTDPQRLEAVRDLVYIELGQRLVAGGHDPIDAAENAQTARGRVRADDVGSYYVESLSGGRKPLTSEGLVFVASELATLMNARTDRQRRP